VSRRVWIRDVWKMKPRGIQVRKRWRVERVTAEEERRDG